MEKALSEITRREWILYEWLEVGNLGEERGFIMGSERTPDEALEAANEWDFLQSVKDGSEEEVSE